MRFDEVVLNRRMVRSFDDRALDPAAVERIVAAGLRAPSAGFTQGVDLLVLQGAGETTRYWDAALPAEARGRFPWPGLLRAPLLVLVLGSETAYRRRYAQHDKDGSVLDVPWWHVDAAFAAMLLQLAAVDAGFGALFFKVHHPPAVCRAFGVPGDYAPVGVMAAGHPAPDRPSSSVAARARRPAEQVVHRGHW